MSIYTVKKVPIGEVDKLVSFIDNHWKKGHALVKSRALLDFQHLNKEDGTYNFIVAENNETKEYDALVGFIPTSQYDCKLAENGDYWGAIWKCRDDVNNEEINNVAFYIWKQIFKQPYFRTYAAIGISQIAKRIYEVSRIPVAVLNHYYITNDSLVKFEIGSNLQKGNSILPSKMSLVREIDIDAIEDKDISGVYKPLKTINYLKNRYKKHPIYHYEFWGVYNETLAAIFVVRKVKVGNSSILRVIDVLGDLSLCGSIFDEVQVKLAQNGAEYLDLMNYGISPNVFYNMGFHKLDIDQGNTILPNYFEPFERRNVEIDVAYKTKDDNYIVFKGDSDQDRPNIL